MTMGELMTRQISQLENVVNAGVFLGDARLAIGKVNVGGPSLLRRVWNRLTGATDQWNVSIELVPSDGIDSSRNGVDRENSRNGPGTPP